MTETKRGILFCSVSSEEQARGDKTSLITQERDGRAWADANNVTLTDVIIVGGFSRRYYTYAEFVEAAALDGFHDPARMWQHWERQDFDLLITRDSSRLGREQSMLSEVFARTIHAGAELYTLREGAITEANYRPYTSMLGFSAASQVDNLVKGQIEAKIKLASRGLPTASRYPYSHDLLRDKAGKQIALLVKEERRRLWDDLATVFLSGVSYLNIERVLFEQYGHINEDKGKPFAKYFFYHILHNPYFWGHGAYGFNSNGSKNGQKVGAWVYDPSCPAPEGVHIFYNVHTPVYTGDLALRVQGELRRRAMAIQGKARPYRTHLFTGLLLCGVCGRHMVYKGDGAYACQSKDTARQGARCENYPRITESRVQTWVHVRLQEMLEYDMPDLLARRVGKTNYKQRIAALKREGADLEGQARKLILLQSKAPRNLTTLYDEQLQVLSDQIDGVKRTLAETERAARTEDTSAAQQAFRDVPENIDDLWTWESTAINQLLHRLMGTRRLVIRAGEVVGTDEKPPHPNRKERERTYFGKSHGARIKKVV